MSLLEGERSAWKIGFDEALTSILNFLSRLKIETLNPVVFVFRWGLMEKGDILLGVMCD